ncbi:MAG: hypothetical protein ABT22_12480 [Thiobacillus sp. SCN 64-317]|nr:MAG: hypothetical protein ABT22_12480 [Thiobacillus sp. SCN 64-317]
MPVGLADDADAVALRFQQPSDQRHAEAGMVDVGITRDQDDVARIPAERGHFGTRHRQEGGGAEARRPVLAVGEQGLGHDRHLSAEYAKKREEILNHRSG